MRWGLIGGGEGSQIGPVHRICAAIDGLFHLGAAALDADPARGRDFARRLGVAEDRAYGDWRGMLRGETARADRVELVTVATPNATHFEIAKAFLDAGIHVLCEKPLTVTVEEAEALVAAAARSGALCAVNYGYTGYPMVREARAMVRRGDLGRIRVAKLEFAHGHHADGTQADHPRIRWRYDPAQAGRSAQFADCGIHALHMAAFVCDQQAVELSARFSRCVASRELEDDASVDVRMDGGAIVHLWTSSIAIGRMHGLCFEIFGEKGGLRWSQEQPNQLYWTPLNEATRIVERATAGLSPQAQRASRVTAGHTEGMPLAFANLYRDLAEQIAARRAGRAPESAALDLPTVVDGLRSVAAIEAAVHSAAEAGRWVDARPPSLR